MRRLIHRLLADDVHPLVLIVGLIAGAIVGVGAVAAAIGFGLISR